MKQIIRTLFAACVLLSCTGRAAEREREPVVGLPCEGCEAVFVGLPDSIAWSARIAPGNEPGDAMRIDGIVRDKAGRPAGNVIVYAYHTDNKGIYPTDTRFHVRHGRLRGWARTGVDGRYRFDTIRPAGYPNTDIAQHVHMHIIEVGRCTYYIDDIQFDDDPRLTTTARGYNSGRGGGGVVKPVKDATGTWLVTRDIVLGEKISDYPERR
jgi:protocatechuate 3,4-dioxygenase beta subunit